MDFLQCLMNPVLPVRIVEEAVTLYESEGDKRTDILQQMLYRLPKDNAMTFVYLVSFFRELLACKDKNKLTPEKISEIFCECLIGEERLGKRAKEEPSPTFQRQRRLSPAKTITEQRRKSLVRPSGPLLMRQATLTSPTDDAEEDGELAEVDEKLTVEQMKSKMRYQGLLLHFFD